MMSMVSVGDALDPHYRADVLADSISPDGVRLTTFRLVYPRFIHSEMMTHRDKSRNAASSRAIPTERLIEQVLTDPFVPATFNQRVPGMGVGDEFDDVAAQKARAAWRSAAQDAAEHAAYLMAIGLDKSRANRLLEAFLWYTAIFTGTYWDNMLGLRDHPGAQLEIQAVARTIRAGFEASTPQEIGYQEWHLPLVTEMGDLETRKMMSASRCARVSFDRTDDEPLQRTIDRAKMLLGNGHFSPFEHVARPIEPSDFDDDVMASKISMTLRSFEVAGYEPENMKCGNFRGWVQMRSSIPNEDRFDLLVDTA